MFRVWTGPLIEDPLVEFIAYELVTVFEPYWITFKGGNAEPSVWIVNLYLG